MLEIKITVHMSKEGDNHFGLSITDRNFSVYVRDTNFCVCLEGKTFHAHIHRNTYL